MWTVGCVVNERPAAAPTAFLAIDNFAGAPAASVSDCVALVNDPEEYVMVNEPAVPASVKSVKVANPPVVVAVVLVRVPALEVAVIVT